MRFQYIEIHPGHLGTCSFGPVGGELDGPGGHLGRQPDGRSEYGNLAGRQLGAYVGLQLRSARDCVRPRPAPH